MLPVGLGQDGQDRRSEVDGLLVGHGHGRGVACERHHVAASTIAATATATVAAASNSIVVVVGAGVDDQLHRHLATHHRRNGGFHVLAMLFTLQARRLVGHAERECAVALAEQGGASSLSLWLLG